jgi:hypothetical protein
MRKCTSRWDHGLSSSALAYQKENEKCCSTKSHTFVIMEIFSHATKLSYSSPYAPSIGETIVLMQALISSG